MNAMDTLLNKLKEKKRIIYFCLCGLFVFLLLARFIQNLDNDAGAIAVIVTLLRDLCLGAIFAAGLYGMLTGREEYSKVAFALLLGFALYALIAGVLDGMDEFDNFDGARAGYVLYYVFAFITGLFGTAFAVLTVLGWILGRDDLKKYGAYVGICWVGMTVLMIVFTIVRAADKQDWLGWSDVVESFYDVFYRAFVLILATSGVLSYAEAASAKNKTE